MSQLTDPVENQLKQGREDPAPGELRGAPQASALASPIARWLALGGVLGPVQFILLFTIAGLLRPDYSPIHQAISDLGVGDNAWLLNGSCVVNGLLLIGFAVGFALSMRSALSRGWRWSSAALLTLHGFGLIVAGIFTEAPATLTMHWLVGANLAFLGPVVAFLVTGLALRRDKRWRGWGNYTLLAGAVTLTLVLIMFWVFTPGSAVASLRLGGLMERVVMIVIEVWYIAFGWRLFRGASENHVYQR
jgi:hypothetical membrane protein